MVKIAMIVGVARNGIIGSKQAIPWKIPSDMAFFKQTTMGKPIVMGRKQFETVGRPLPGRTNIVVTRQPGFSAPGVMVFATIDAALDEAARIAGADGVEEIMIIGGGELYAQLMDRADRLYVSHIDLAPEGDVVFPPIDPAIWSVVDQPVVESNPKDEAAYRVNVYARHKGTSH